ncbi:hypothetical protein [Catellatospora sp. NPDC049609]|uniref:hypothetical protein n=1 Tax=Catellatospora sp. NPDC049609 TaxID=3155505 RepID=UPI00341C1111
MSVDDLRTRLSEEYGEERFTMTVSEIEHRAGRGSRRRRGAWAAVAAATAVVAVGWLVWPQAPAGKPEPPATPSAVPTASAASTAWRAGFAAECDRKWLAHDRTGLRPADQGQLPPLLIEQFHGELGIRVYGNEWLTAECERTARDTTVGFSRSADNTLKWLPDAGTGIPYFAARRGRATSPDSDPQPRPEEIAGDYIIGRAPAGAVKIEALTPDGRVFPGGIGGHLFLVWAPEGGLRDAVVRADVNVSQVLVADSAELPGAYDERAMDAACRQDLATGYAAAGRIDMPPRRFVRRDGQRVVFLYGSPDTVVACSRLDDTISLTVVRRVPAAPQGWQPAKHFHHTSDTQGWLFGVAPDGATGGTLTLRNGRKVPVRISDGWYGTSWTADPHDEDDRPRRVELIVDGETWTVPAAQ